MRKNQKFYQETTFKKTRIGKIPDDWEVIPIGRIIKEIKLRNVKKEKLTVFAITKSLGLVPSLQFFHKRVFSRDIDRYKIIKNMQFAYSPIHLNEGAIGLGREKGLISPLHIVFEMSSDADPRFFEYLFKSSRLLLIYTILPRGSVRRRGSIRFQDFSKIDVQLPTIREQKKIVEVLSVVDSAIQKTDNVIAMTENLKKGVMNQLLTRGIGHQESKRTEIGEIPHDWDVVRIKEITNRIKRGPSKRTNRDGKGIVYLTSDYLTDDGFIEFRNLKYLEERSADDYGKYLLKPNDLLVNCVNSLEQIGKVAVFQGYAKQVMVGFNNFALTLKEGINPFLVKYIFLQDRFKKILRRVSKAAVQQVSFSTKDLFRVKIPLPPSEKEQEEIVNNLSTIDEQIQLEREMKVKLERIKQSLMDLLLTGKIRIKMD